MKFPIIYAVVYFAANLAQLLATNVTFAGTGANRTVVDAARVQVAAGSLVWVGTFANENFEYNPSVSISGNVAAITSAGGWERFGLDTATDVQNSGVSSNLTISATGKATGGVTDNTTGATKANFFNGKSVYLWIFNTGDVNTATQTGIFRAPNAGTPWIFPTNASGVGDDVTLSTNPSVTPVVNAIGGVGLTTSTQLILIPEPSSYLLIGFGLAGVMSGRFRSRNCLVN